MQHQKKLLKDAGNKFFKVILEKEPEIQDVNDDGTQDANKAVSVVHTWQRRSHTSIFSTTLLNKFCY